MNRTTAGLLVLLTPFSASAAEYTANSVKAADGLIRCITASNGWFTQSTGPCAGFIPPTRIAMGEAFEIDGKKLRIGFIGVTVIEKDMHYPPVRAFKAGDITCTAAASRSQVPLGRDGHSGSWLYINRCEPVD